MGKDNAKRLLVEGRDDLVSVAELVGSRVNWPSDPTNAPVHIVDCRGVENLLERFYISGNLKEERVECLGIILDADDACISRWHAIRVECGTLIPTLPDDVPAGGLIIETPNNKRFGVWIMPDNLQPGSLETFLQELIPSDQHPLWLHAVASVQEAKQYRLPVTDAHLGKAQLYTWLAWQEPPGQLCGRALTKKILNPDSPSAEPFVAWFRALFAI